jgi:hypothetical protein
MKEGGRWSLVRGSVFGYKFTTAAKEHRNQVIWGRIGPWIFFCVFTVFLFYEQIFIAIEFDLKNYVLFYYDISLSVFVLFRNFNQDSQCIEPSYIHSFTAIMEQAHLGDSPQDSVLIPRFLVILYGW